MKLHSIASLMLAVTALFTTVSCSAAPVSSTRTLDTANKAVAPAAPPSAGADYSASATSSGNASAPSGDRMIIRTSYVQMVVGDVNDAIAKTGSLAQEMGGFVVSSESQQQGTERLGKISVRVPSDKVDEALGKIRALAIRVDRDTSSNKDVTEEYVDQDARLRTLKATEEQYLQLMKNTRTTEDIIKVQQSLQQVRQQIEQTEGRIKYLQRSTEMAVISVDLSTAGAAKPLTNGAWNPMDVANVAVQALIGVILLAAGLAIWVIVFAPVWVPFLLLARWWRRRNRRLPGGPPPQPVGEAV